MRLTGKFSKEQLKRLKDVYETGKTVRIRERAHATILSSRRGHSTAEIVSIFDVDRDSVSSWLTRWESNKEEGLFDLPKSGRPSMSFKDLKKRKNNA